MQPENVNLPYVQFNATNRIGSLSRWKYHRSPIQERKKKWLNIRSWVDGDSAKDPEDVLEKQLKTRQVGILEAKGECYFKAERVMNYDKLIGQQRPCGKKAEAA